MNQFAGYAKFYDDMYQNKPYEEEVDNIELFFKKHSNIPVKNILSLGCGTGTYEIILAKRGYTVHGVDLSRDMLDKAKQKINLAGVGDKITLEQGDMTNIKIDGQYDAVLMMFNIAGYVHTQIAFTKLSANVSSCLKTGGVFIFDAWNEPAVVADPPTDRTKVVEKNGKTITRVTKGHLDLLNKLVKISFDVTEEEGGVKNQQVTEDHPMRYFSVSELHNALKSGGLVFIEATSFTNTEKPVSDKEWDMFVVSRKQ